MFKAVSSISSITIFDIIEDKEKPIGQLKICLLMASFHSKNDCKQISNTSVSSGRVRLFLPPNVQSSPTRSATIVLAVSIGIEVNKLFILNGTCDSDLPSLMDEINSTNSEEFLTVYWGVSNFKEQEFACGIWQADR